MSERASPHHLKRTTERQIANNDADQRAGIMPAIRFSVERFTFAAPSTTSWRRSGRRRCWRWTRPSWLLIRPNLSQGNGRLSQKWLGTWAADDHGMKQTRQHLAQAKAAIEAVGRFTEVTAGVLGQTDGVVAAADGSLDVGEHAADPAHRVLGGQRASPWDNGARGPASEKRRNADRPSACLPCKYASATSATSRSLNGGDDLSSTNIRRIFVIEVPLSVGMTSMTSPASLCSCLRSKNRFFQDRVTPGTDF